MRCDLLPLLRICLRHPAGQQDTFPNVIGERAILDSVRRCWASLFTERAILYRIQNGFPHDKVGISVVVQRMVMAEVSGVLFTADPVTGHRHTMTIDASFGLGEALVGGLVTPDTYRVDKRTRFILAREVAIKQVAILPTAKGGTRKVELPLDRQGEPALTDEQVLALTELGMRIESHHGIPQDIEWALSPAMESPAVPHGFYILQSRPITTLYPIEGLESPDGSLHVYFSLGHQQSMTRAMAPLSLSSLQVIMPVGHEKDRFDNAYIRSSGGRLFADLTLLLRHRIGRRFILGLLAQLDALAPEAVRQVIQRPEFWPASWRCGQRLRIPWRLAKLLLTIFARVLAALWWRPLGGFREGANDLIENFTAEARNHLEATHPGPARIQALLEILPTIFPTFLQWVPEAAAGVVASRMLPRLARPWLEPESCEALVKGIPGNVINEMNLELDELAESARQYPELVERFEHLDQDPEAWLEGSASLPCSQPFLDGWRVFMERYGI